MNTKRYVLASLGVAVFIFIYGWVVHGILLADFWAEQLVEGAMRPPGEEVLWAIVVSCLLQGYALAFIFTRGYQNLGIMEGVRFGLLIAWFIAAIYVLQFALSPISMTTMVYGLIIDGIMYIIAGVILAALYKEDRAPSPQFG